MQEQLKQRVLYLAEMITQTEQTVREIAKQTGLSKSTVHKDLTDRLKLIQPILAKEVEKILQYHKSVRHIRGGEATKQMWQCKLEKNGVDLAQDQ